LNRSEYSMKASPRFLPVRAATLAIALVASLATLLHAGCVVYEPAPAYGAPSSFDRAWGAAAGAMQEQGVAITEQNRATGVIRGSRGTVNVTSTVRTQADGKVRVEINATGPMGSDAGLAERISASYDRRMGR
jgi:hypothetical protein